MAAPTIWHGFAYAEDGFRYFSDLVATLQNEVKKRGGKTDLSFDLPRKGPQCPEPCVPPEPCRPRTDEMGDQLDAFLALVTRIVEDGKTLAETAVGQDIETFEVIVSRNPCP